MHSFNCRFRNADFGFEHSAFRIPRSTFRNIGYRLLVEAGGMRAVKSSRFLLRTGERKQLAVLVMPAEEGDTQRRAEATDAIVVSRID
jgi:hypothetical protein